MDVRDLKFATRKKQQKTSRPIHIPLEVINLALFESLGGHLCDRLDMADFWTKSY